MEMMNMMSKVDAERCVEAVIKALMPAVVNGFWYGLACKSVRSQADSTLLRHKGDRESAVKEVLHNQSENLDNWSNLLSLKKSRVDSCLNQCGVSPRHFRPLWHRLRSLALLACLFGMDVTDAAIQGEIILCLAEAEVKGVPAQILCNDASSIAACLLLQQVQSTDAGEVSLASVHRVLNDSVEEAASRGRAVEYFRVRQHELRGAWLLKESAKVKSYTEQQTIREEARREFAIAGLPHRVQDVEAETLRVHKSLQSWARAQSLLGMVFSAMYYLLSMSVMLSHSLLVLMRYTLVVSASSLLKIYHFLDFRRYAAIARQTVPSDVELGLS